MKKGIRYYFEGIPLGIHSLRLTVRPEKLWLEDEFPFGKAYFQVRTVGFGEGQPKVIIVSLLWPFNSP